MNLQNTLSLGHAPFLETEHNWFTVFLIITFTTANALFYLQQVVGSYYVFVYQKQQAAAMAAKKKRDEDQTNKNPSASNSEMAESGTGSEPSLHLRPKLKIGGMQRSTSTDSLVGLNSRVGRALYPEDQVTLSPRMGKRSDLANLAD